MRNQNMLRTRKRASVVTFTTRRIYEYGERQLGCLRKDFHNPARRPACFLVHTRQSFKFFYAPGRLAGRPNKVVG